jgi:Uma2 family endonuclease
MTTTTQRITLDEFLAHHDGTDTCYELVQGELKPVGLGTGKHGKITQFLDDRLNDEIHRTAQPWTSQRFTVGIQSPRGNRWDTCRIPDITVMPIEQWDAMEDRESVIRAHEPPPLLVVEVVSPSTVTTDYRTKRTEYAVLDIAEYGIVDPTQLTVTICTWNEGAYDDQVFQGNQRIVSATFPDLQLTAAQVLQFGQD